MPTYIIIEPYSTTLRKILACMTSKKSFKRKVLYSKLTFRQFAI